MSRENVEIVLRAHEAWNRDDFDAARALMHPDFELRQPPDLFLGMEGVYRGAAGVRQWWDGAKEPWAYFKSHIERTLDRIGQYPEAWPPFTQNTRRCQTRRFPYGVVYQILTSEILIVAIAHLHWEPGYWRDRI